ncbi:MAG: cytochrome c biogenesis protein [Bacteroidota bacterium]
MIWKALLAVWLTVVTVLALGLPMVPEPTHWYEFPLVPLLEEKGRILFFHVPTAWLSVVGFLTSMVYGIRYLRGRAMDDDIRSSAAAGVGLGFCLLATVTGAVWARFTWGEFWNWDPRQTSIFFLLLVYGAYFALRSAVEGEEKRAVLAAAYSVMAAITMPFFMFILPRTLPGLHPQTLSDKGIQMNPTMLAVLLASLAGFTGLGAWMWGLRVRVQEIALRDASLHHRSAL